jgi:hypothetical protein
VSYNIANDSRFDPEERRRVFCLKKALSYAKKKTSDDSELELDHEDLIETARDFEEFLQK